MPELRAHLIHPHVWKGMVSGHVHSVFDHAVNLLMDVRGKNVLLPIVPKGELLPDTLEAPPNILKALAACPQGAPVQWLSYRLTWIDGSCFVKRDTWIGRMPRIDCNWPGEKGLLLNVPYGWIDRVETSLATILFELDNGKINNAAQTAENIIGLGGGLTPAADDALVGALAVFCAKHAPLHFLTEKQLSRTTLVSAHYLRCAQQGCFSQRVIKLIMAPEDEKPKAMQHLCAWGGTSGWDTLYGIDLAMRLFGIDFR